MEETLTVTQHFRNQQLHLKGPSTSCTHPNVPTLEVKITEVKNLFNTLQTHALIFRFNGFWPRSYDLHNWIHSNWTTSCQVLLCSKGFFVVHFESQDDYQKILVQGPWFWGRAGLFITPWFPEFDVDNMVVTKMPVWVRLPNLPLPFWHHEVLEDIGNRFRVLHVHVLEGLSRPRGCKILDCRAAKY